MASGPESRDAATRLYLGSEQGLVAEFELGVPLRADAGAAIEELRGMGLSVIIASGDSGATVTQCRARARHNPRAFAAHAG